MKLVQKRDKWIVQMIEEGEAPAALARLFNMPESAIRRIYDRHSLVRAIAFPDQPDRRRHHRRAMG